MKKIILSVAMVSMAFAFAQKKEVSAAFKAMESGDVATANAQISAAESVLGGKTELLTPEQKEQYYYAKGLALLKSGKTTEGAAILSKISDLGKSKIYEGKDGKNRVYFVGKEAADASGIAGLKETTYQPTLVGKLGEVINPILQSTHKQAIDAYNAKNYSVSAPKFQEAYYLLKSAGQDNKQMLYYSAITYALAKDNNKAIDVYKDLIASGYTGVETKYKAKDTKSGQEQEFDKTSWELYKKTGASSGYTDFKTEVTPSVEQELYETATGLMIDTQRYDEAIENAGKGLKKFPNSNRLTELQGLAYYRSGKTEQFIANLKETVAKNPQDKESWFNLGVLSSKDPAKRDEAIGYYQKALEIDPRYIPAHQNLTYLLIDSDNDGNKVAKYEELRKAGKIDQANKIMEERREGFKKAIPYAEKWYAVDSNNIDVVSLLKSLYMSIHNEAKHKEFKAKEDALKK